MPLFKFEIDVSKIFTVSDWDSIKDFDTLENRAALATQILQGTVKIKPTISYGEYNELLALWHGIDLDRRS